MTALSFQHGEIIFREGEESDCCYIIEKGTVEVFKRLHHGTVLLAVLGTGEILGEMGMISDQPRSASAAAEGEVVLRVISRESFASMFTSLPPELLQTLRALMERLRITNQKVSKLVEKQSQFQLVSAAPPPVKRVVLSPLSAALKEVLGKGMAISLPYRVGAKIVAEEPNPLDYNNLLIPCDNPDTLARNHFSIQRNAQGIVVMDRGSRSGTLVNDQKIGGGAEQIQADLRPGDNVIIAGHADSMMRFCVTWETE